MYVTLAAGARWPTNCPPAAAGRLSSSSS